MHLTTEQFDADRFACAFRDETLLAVFESLELKGPDGSFAGQGMLRRFGETTLLEFVPIPPDGSTIPQIVDSRLQNSEASWCATGTTLDGLQVELRGLHGFGGNFSERISMDGEPHSIRKRFTQRVEEVVIESRDDGPRGSTPVHVQMQAWIANTKFLFPRVATKTEISHPYRAAKTISKVVDSLVGEASGMEYGVRQIGDDVLIQMHSKKEGVQHDSDSDERVFRSLLTGLAIMQGQNVYAWRQIHQRSTGLHRDVLASRLSQSGGAMRPFEDSLQFSDAPGRFLTRSAEYFSGGTETSIHIEKYLWQFRESASSEDVKLHGVLHSCSIFEGLAALLLRTQAGWTRTQLQKSIAGNRFEAVSEFYQVPWAGQFERSASAWKEARHILAHGDLFSPELGEGETIRISRLVAGGILALVFAEMGWDTPPDFDAVENYGVLFPPIFEVPFVNAAETHSRKVPS
jgi:hypothetical protein